jgi:hypothetical protein
MTIRKHRQSSSRSILSQNSLQQQSADSADDGMNLNPSQCFSIIFRGDWTLDLMMMNTNDGGESSSRDKILDALDRIVQRYAEQKSKVSNDVLLLRYVWLDADKDKSSDTINANELGRVLGRINYHMKKQELHKVYEKFGKTIGLDRRLRRQGLTFEQTCTLLHKVKRDSWVVKPVNTCWNQLFGEFMKNGKPRMTVSARTFLDKFLHQKQGETNAWTMETCLRLFAQLHRLEMPQIAGESEPKDPQRIDKLRFEAYLLGEDNCAFDPAKEQYDPRSMRRPISEYWVNSSHNTYLTGDQFTSHSSVDMYSNALYRGCKCLELDVWDGDIGDDNAPIPVVWHGYE